MSKTQSGGQTEPAQPRLPGTNLVRFLCERCPFDTLHREENLRKLNEQKPEMFGLSPLSVPPTSNTGVHHETSNRGAASEEVSD